MGEFFSGLAQALKGLFQVWVVIAPWEQALRVRGGKKIGHLGPGIHFRIPLLDRFFIQSTRLRMADMPIQTLTMPDGRAVTLKGQIGYRISDLSKLYDTLHDAEGTIANLSQMAIADYVVTAEPTVCDPLSIASTVSKSLTENFIKYGLSDVRISITDYAIVRTYRLITQDIWNDVGRNLDTERDHITKE